MSFRGWQSRLSDILRRRRFEDELDEDVRTHLAMAAEDNIDRGMDPADARRAARRSFGNVARMKESYREARGFGLMDHLVRDVRYGCRMLAKHRGFTAMAVLSLTVGIGANAAIFSVVNAILLRPVPVDRPEELVNIYQTEPELPFFPLSYPDVKDLRDGTREVFTGIAATTFVLAQIDRGGGVEAAIGEAVTGDFFPVLGIEPVLGRAIGPQDDVAPGGHPVVMLGYQYWQRDMGGAPEVIGETLRIGGRPYTVIGVAPPDYPGTFRGLVAPAIYAPMMMLDELMGVPLLEERGYQSLFVKARLAPGVTLAEAETTSAAVAEALDEIRPRNWTPGARFTLLPNSDVVLYPTADDLIGAVALLLLVVVGLVLLLACTNLASFLLARALDRRREVAMRLALGASRGALIRQLLTETTLLGLLSGGLGLALAVVLLNGFLAADLSLPYGIAFDLDIGLDSTLLGFTLGLSLLAGTVLGVLPAIRSTRPDLMDTLKTETVGGELTATRRWRDILVVAQVTLSLVLLVGAGLFLRSWQQVLAVDPGFGREPTALMSVMVPSGRMTADESLRYVRRLADRFRELPGVEAVGIVNDLPLDMSFSGAEFNVDGHTPPEGRETFRADRADVDGAFFDAAGIPILRGRAFNDADDSESPSVAIISEAMARRYWPAGDAVGRLLRRPNSPAHRIVGVAGDIKVRTLGEAPRDMIYLPYTQSGVALINFVVRTSGDPAELALSVMTAGREVDPELRVVDTKTMTQHLLFMKLPAQLEAFIVSAFAVLALILATIGVFGAVRYTVATRMREVGIRLALGADSGRVARGLARSGVRLVVVGGVIGWVVSLGVSRLLESLVFGVDAFDTVTFAAATLLLGAAGCLAAYLPSRRASRVDPIAVLRSD